MKRVEVNKLSRDINVLHVRILLSFVQPEGRAGARVTGTGLVAGMDQC